MHIVVFPGWYPTRADALSGDFIQRHIHAIASKCRVTVIIPVKDNSVKQGEKVVCEKGDLSEIFFYYPPTTSVKWIESLISLIRYTYVCLRFTRTINKENKIHLAHLYVLQKNLLVGFLLKWFFKIPYVISEQSTLYIDGRFEMMNFFERQMYKWVFLCASSTHAVSNYLLRSIRQKLKKKFAAVVIPNVVNVDLFCYSTRNLNGVTTFVHVSNMVYQKNVEGMLHAFKKAKVCNNKFLLHLVGPLPSHIPHLIEQLNLSEYVILWNERSYTEVAEIMKQSDVFIFFTRFETFGCVIIEANACGLPVIATDFEVTRELITDGVNGLLVENENVDELALKISEAIVSIDMFDRKAISAQTKEQFNYEVIANKFLGWYNDVLREA